VANLPKKVPPPSLLFILVLAVRQNY